MAMIHNNKYIIAIFIVLITIPVVHAQERKILDWSIPIKLREIAPELVKSDPYKESKKCGNISFGFSQWINIIQSNLIIIKKLPHDDNSDFLSGGMRFTMLCKTNAKINESNIEYNSSKDQWELTGDEVDEYAYSTKYKANQIYQLHTPNASGWLWTSLNYNMRDKDFAKLVNFCLFNKGKTKKLCGGGTAQYIPNKKQLGTTKFDYTPILIKILNTAQFLDDK